MSRFTKNKKAGIAILLAMTLALSIFHTLPYSLSTVKAANGEGSLLSVTTYATKNELMNEFNQDGTNPTIGKIVYGKDSNGNPLEWYILGKDGGKTEDNISIFAASSIAIDKVFNSNEVERNYSYSANTGYGDASGNIVVYSNHYGASELRSLLNGLATNSAYFTIDEQSLMQSTTVITSDAKNSIEYVTTDVLYALYGDLNNRENLKAGSYNDKVLPMSLYCSDGDDFWLRSPNPTSSLYNYSLTAIVGNSISGDTINDKYAVRPASNINLSSVVFASAATVASDTVVAGIISDGTAMTLKLDGSNTSIGSVVYDNASGILLAQNETNDKVAVMVQGNDGENDWYYSKVIADKEFINASDIKSEVGLTVDVSLDDCKIWVEATNNGLTYVKEATEATIINDIAITGVDTPIANTGLDNEATISAVGISTQTPAITWKVEDDTVTGNAKYNTIYTVNITLETVANAYFATNIEAKVNGNIATVIYNQDGTITISYTYPATEKDTIIYTATGYEDEYDGESHGISVNVTEPEDATISYSTDEGNNKEYSAINPTFTDIGSYTVYYKIEKENYNAVEGNKTVKINKRELNIKAEDQNLIVGAEIDTSKYTAEGLLEGHSINTVTLMPSTSVTTGTKMISVEIDKIIDEQGIDVTANYEIVYTSGQLVIKEPERDTEESKEETTGEDATEENTTEENATEDVNTGDNETETKELDETTEDGETVEERVESPDTEDSNPINIWLICLVVSGFVVVGLNKHKISTQ
ncbi:MAG: hypothetical protein IJC76_05270 [Lachnospiraceae bacterium]|nr:hypothetical protein [Lachnospiraceae bacterium]